MKKFLLSVLMILMSTLVWAVAGEEVAGSVNVPAPRLVDIASESSRVSLFSSGGTSTYRYTATGGLSTSASGDDITLYFDVSDYFAEIKSARIELMAYDVDYPGATEADITYLNGVDLGQWLKGENGDWEKNTIQITKSILKTPAVNGGSVRNTFYVDVNAHNGGWVTCISEAILIIEGTAFGVTASDGTDAEGVHVQWTSLPNATYTLWRGEKPGEKTKQLGEGAFTKTEFLDTEVSSGKVYYYTIEATMPSGERVMASDSGYHDAILHPNIVKIELPDFWLENRAPLAITWNNYDKTQCRVASCLLVLTGPGGRGVPIPIERIKPNERLVFDVAEKTSFVNKDFGKYNLHISWNVEVFKDGEWKSLQRRFVLDQHLVKQTIEVFFNKYNNHNWFKFWPKMGAINLSPYKIETGSEYGGYDGYPESETKDQIKYGNYPTIRLKVSLVNANEYYVTDFAASSDKPNPTREEKLKEIGLPVTNKKGLEFLATVILHENRHGELDKEYCSQDVPIIGDLYQNSGFSTMKDLLNALNKLKDLDDKGRAYKNKILELYENGKYVCDLDGDGVLDSNEGNGICIGNPDTYNLKDIIHEEYAEFGDNEYLARLAEGGAMEVNTQKDWAFPGNKRCAEASGMSRVEWDMSEERENALKTFEKFGYTNVVIPGPSISIQPVQPSPMSINSLQTYSAMSLANEEVKVEMDGGDLTTLPSRYDINNEDLMLEGDILDQTVEYETSGAYPSLVLSISFVNNGETIDAAKVSGYLVNEKDEPVAFARTTVDFPQGSTKVVLEFPGKALQKIKSNSYRLALLQVLKRRGDRGRTIFSKTEFSNNTFAYKNTQFTGNAANFLYNTFSEEKTQDALTVEVNGYVAVPGIYQLEARLEDVDGNIVSHVGYEKEFASGEVTVSFEFPSEEIYLSRADGPYEICFVRMSQNGASIDERRMPYTTKAYTYADFTPEHVCLVVNEASFTRGDDVVGTDGLITNLSFSFDVDYQGEEDVQCQGRLSLYGENDTIVAVSQETFSLVKGRNTLEFLVDGASIQKSGVDGPYYVKDVLLRPQNGAAETFVPTMAPIELNADDFGAYPFVVTDKVVARENNGDCDLILPIEIARAHTLTLYAMLVDAKEQCVATATTSKTYSAPCEDELILTFTAADIAASGRSGPYKVRLIQATTDIPNIEMASIPVPVCTPTYEVVNDEVTITGCTSPFGALEIPGVIEGYPVTTIAAAAFKDCSNLTSVTIPEGVTSIGSSAFLGCSGLTSVTIPNGVTEIGDYAFLGCSSLTLVTIPSSVISIGNDVFEGNTSVTFNGILECSKWPLWLNKSIKASVKIPANAISIDGSAFRDCVGLISVTIPEGVTSIGSSAFSGCSSLSSVTIPSSVTSIGDDAFYGCSSLTSVTIPSSVTSIGNYAFFYCRSLTSVTIPEGVTSIGSSAFSGCSSLTSVTIPSSVTEIGDYAFLGCSSLTSVTISESVTSIGVWAFSDCSSLTSVTIPLSVTSIGNYAFYGCTSLTSFIVDSANQHYSAMNGLLCCKDGKMLVVCPGGLTSVMIPDSVTSIGTAAFDGCSSLTSVTIPSSVTSIGDYAFYDCSSLMSVTIPESVTEIGESAFTWCESLTSFVVDSKNQHFASVNGLLCSEDGKTLIACPGGLTSVTIPSSVTSIEMAAFDGCSSLTSVTIPEGVTSIGSYTFYNCSSLTSVTIPEGVTSIGDGAFVNCSNLTSVTIPEGVTEIGEDTFAGCSSLTTVTIPSSVTSIGEWAFEGCSGLTTVTISEGVTSIGSFAFYGCSGLTSVTISEGVTSIGDYVFYGCSNLTSFFVDVENQEYSVIDGLLCSKDGKTLIECPKGLTSVAIPEGLTSIEDGAFEGCSGLTSVTIPEGLASIGSSAFRSCSGLTSVTIPSSVTSIGERAFEGCSNLYTDANGIQYESEAKTLLISIPNSTAGVFEVPNSVRYIGDSAFAGCSALTSVTIPSSVTSIGYRAFEGCSSLTSVTIPEGVTSIGNSAFRSCSGLTSVTISEGVTSIGDWAFYKCYSLTSVTIPSSVTSIGDDAFYGCSNLWKDENGVQYESAAKVVLIDVPTSMTGEFVIPNTVCFIHSDAFSYCSSLTSVTIPEGVTSIGDGAFVKCYNLTSVTIPEGVTSIGEDAFSYCSSLTSVTIPSSVTSIGDYAFYKCYRLTSVTIPEGVTSIGSYTFYVCYRLTSVTIPSSVTSIGDYAFYGCSGLTSVTIPSSVTSIGSDAFYNCSYLTSVTFEGAPLSCGVRCFENVPATGYYLSKHTETWEKIIVDGKWNGLTMVQKAVATLPEGLPEVTGEWLTDVLEASGITSGSAVLADGTTVEALEAARLLGITPSVSVSNNIATVAAENTFEVSEVVVADNAVSLAVMITAEIGRFPSEVSLGGAVKLMVCDTLNGEWTEVTPLPTQITLTRMSDNEAKLSITQTLGTYQFFKVVVK